jgi:hypothetical protein
MARVGAVAYGDIHISKVQPPADLAARPVETTWNSA